MLRESVSRERLGALLFYAIVILVAYLGYIVFEPFLAPLAWGAVLTIVTYPLYEKLLLRAGKNSAAFAATTIVLLVLIVPMIFVMISFVKQGVGAAQALQFTLQKGQFGRAEVWWDHLQDSIPSLGSQDLATALQGYGEKAAAYAALRLGTILKHTAVFFFHLFVMTLAMFYLYRDGDSLVARLREILPFAAKNRERMILGGRDLIFASVTSSLVAALVHALFGGLAFLIAGVKAPLFWGVMMGFFSFIPVFGSALIWVPISLSLILTGQWGHGILVLALCGIIVGGVDNVVRPWLISGRSEMSGLVVFIGVIGGIEAFGLLGIVLGPMILATCLILLEVYAPPKVNGNSSTGQAAKKPEAVLE